MNLVTHYFNTKFKGNWNEIFKAIINREDKDKVNNYKPNISTDIYFLDITDENYPNKFKELKQPPFVLHYSKSINWVNKKNIWLLENCGSLNNEEIKYLINIGYGFVLFENQENIWKTLDKLITLRARVIFVSTKGIENISNRCIAKNKNVCVMSEIPDNYDVVDYQLDFQRIACAASDIVLCVGDTNKIEEYLLNVFGDCQVNLVLYDKQNNKKQTNFPRVIKKIKDISLNTNL